LMRKWGRCLYFVAGRIHDARSRLQTGQRNQWGCHQN
jgi:hypothetical protein